MNIHSDSYTIATLDGQEEAVEVIRHAEEALARLTGNRTVTLIAYEKSGGTDSRD